MNTEHPSLASKRRGRYGGGGGVVVVMKERGAGREGDEDQAARKTKSAHENN
jgi:hypothetical protein